MSPDEVLSKLSELGVNITRKTLLNYEAYGLPKPERGSGGRGVGRFTDYPPNVIEYAFAIYHMLNSSNYPSLLISEISDTIPLFADNPFVFTDIVFGTDILKKHKETMKKEEMFTREQEEKNEILEKANFLFKYWVGRNFFKPILSYLMYLFIVRYNIDQFEPISIIIVGSSIYGIKSMDINGVNIIDDGMKLERIDIFGKERLNTHIHSKKGIAKFVLGDIKELSIYPIEIKTNLNKK